MADTWNAIIGRLGVPTGDGRVIEPAGFTNRPLPLPLSWQRMSDDGHQKSVIVGRIDSMTTDMATGNVNATGVLLDPAIVPEVTEVAELIRNGVIGPSMDPGACEIDWQVTGGGEGYYDEEGWQEPAPLNELMVFTTYECAGATLVSVPAFTGVSISLADAPNGDSIEAPFAALTAAAAPVLPPRAWFDNPKLDGPTPLTITDDGRVYGHCATWGTCHVGLPGCVTPPVSFSQYAYFTTGATMTDGGEIPTGKLTVGGGHADGQLGYAATAEHYDNACTAVATVTAGEDEYGIWVAGAILAAASEEQVEALRQSPLSGDWRSIGGNLELVAAHAVNVPGFPVPRARAVVADARQVSLVASAQFPPTLVEQTLPNTLDTKALARDIAQELVAAGLLSQGGPTEEIHVTINGEPIAEQVINDERSRARARLALAGIREA